MRSPVVLVIISLLTAGGLWWALGLPVYADDGDFQTGDFQACATLVGEGELCGWPEVDPEEYGEYDSPEHDVFGEDPVCPSSLPAGDFCDNPDADGAKQDEAGQDEAGCPIVVGEGVLCYGPEIAEPPVDENVDEDNESDVVGSVDESTEDCVIPIGEGVIGCGPEIPEIPAQGQNSALLVFVPIVVN